MLAALFFGSCLQSAYGHMGISTPVPVDRAVGDAYRYPNPSQACHGKGAGAKYTWVWTPKSSGQCEIYQNCFTDMPAGDLVMSGGAAHDGGPCKLYECTGAITAPPCVRNQLPASFGTCKEIASDMDCTKKGKFAFSGSGAIGGGTTPTAAPPPTPISSFPPGATVTKIRCGLNWNDANDKCGTPCTTDSVCTGGQKCYADLKDCPAGTTIPVAKPIREAPATDPDACVSNLAHIKDTWCAGMKCAPIYKDLCCSGVGCVSKSSQAVTLNCVVYATFEGQTWTDVALIYDTSVAELKAANPSLTGDLVADTVLEIPGDCKKAREQAANLGDSSETSPAMSSGTPSLAAATVFAAAVAFNC